MKLTSEKLKELDKIPTSEVQQDLKEAEKELDYYKRLLSTFRERPQENRVDIYMTEGKVRKGEEFIDELNQILTYRKNK